MIFIEEREECFLKDYKSLNECAIIAVNTKNLLKESNSWSLDLSFFSFC